MNLDPDQDDLREPIEAREAQRAWSRGELERARKLYRTCIAKGRLQRATLPRLLSRRSGATRRELATARTRGCAHRFGPRQDPADQDSHRQCRTRISGGRPAAERSRDGFASPQVSRHREAARTSAGTPEKHVAADDSVLGSRARSAADKYRDEFDGALPSGFLEGKLSSVDARTQALLVTVRTRAEA